MSGTPPREVHKFTAPDQESNITEQHGHFPILKREKQRERSKIIREKEGSPIQWDSTRGSYQPLGAHKLTAWIRNQTSLNITGTFTALIL